MKDILIKYPIKILQQELINIRTNYRLEKKKLIEILRTMKSIKKLTKEQLVDLLIENKVDISKLPKLEDLEKPIKKEGKPKISTGKNQSLTRKQLEEMKLKSKPKKELSKELLDLYKTIKDNLRNIDIYSSIIYERAKPYVSLTDSGYIYDIQEAEEKIKQNPRLINIKKKLVNFYNYLEERRNKLNNTYDNFIRNIKKYYELSPYRFNFFIANYNDYIDNLLKEIFEGKKKEQRTEYNDEFNNYIFEIGKVRVDVSDPLVYRTIVNREVVPLNQKLVNTEIYLLISKFLEQLDYDNIQDFYDNNKDLFVPNLKLYEKFIKAFKLKTDAETFIKQTKEKYDYQIIQDFKIKSEEEIMGTKKKTLNNYKIKSEEEIIETKKKTLNNYKIVKNPTPDQYIQMKNDYQKNKYMWSLEAFEKGLSVEDIIYIADLGKEEFKKLNAYFTPDNAINTLLNESFFYQYIKSLKNDGQKIIRILEPTGGVGNIIFNMLENTDFNFLKIDFVEINNDFIEIAKARLYKYKDIITFHKKSLFDFKPDYKYDFIIGNPPFKMEIKPKTIYDVDFFIYCYNLLKNDSRIALIMSTSALRLKTESHIIFKNILIKEEETANENELMKYNRLFKIKSGFTKQEKGTKAGETSIESYLFLVDKKNV